MVRIVTLNLNYFVDKHGPWSARKNLILRQLSQIDPDIVNLQAVARNPQTNTDQAFELCEALRGFQSHFFAPADGAAQGSAVISKLPIEKKTAHKLELLPDLDDTSSRLLLDVHFKGKDGSMRLLNGHFSWVEEQAKRNVAEAVSVISKERNMPTVLAGDLNNPPDSAVFAPLRELGLEDGWKVVNGDDDGFTFESDRPSMRIDYFWLSAELASRARKAELVTVPPDSAVRLSDHLGVVLALDVNI